MSVKTFWRILRRLRGISLCPPAPDGGAGRMGPGFAPWCQDRRPWAWPGRCWGSSQGALGCLHLSPHPAQGVPAVILHCLLYYHNSPDQGQPITFMAALWPANGTHGEEIPGSESSWQRLYKFPKLHRNFWYTEHTLLWDLAKAQENFKTVLGREREKLRGFEERQKPSWNVQGESLFQLTELNAGSEEAIFQ